jgi:hypothetical protein
MQESLLGNPAFSLDQVLMHDGNLSGRTSEADKAELEPVPKRLAECHRLDSLDALIARFVIWRQLTLLHLKTPDVSVRD